MADFRMCPSSERTMSFLPLFAYPSSEWARLQSSLSAGTLSSLKTRTAQSLSRFAPAHLRPKSRLAAVGLRNAPAGAAFTQGSLCSVHPRTLERYRAGQTQMKRLSADPLLKGAFAASTRTLWNDTERRIVNFQLSIVNCQFFKRTSGFPPRQAGRSGYFFRSGHGP